MLRGITGTKGSKCRLYFKVFEITELPPPTPPKAYVEISRGNHKDTTTETFITGTCIAVWEQEMMLPVTMYTNSSGQYDEKEVKIAVKDSANGKSIAKSVVNVSEHIKPGATTQVKLLLETKSKGFMGSKTTQCPLRVSIRLETCEPPAGSTDSPPVSTVEHTEDVSELSFTDLGDESDDNDDFGASPAFAPQAAQSRGHARSQSTANPFDGEPTPAPKPVSAPGKKKQHRRANSVSLNGNGFSMGGIPTRRAEPPERTYSSPNVSVSMNPFDDPSPMSAPPPRERESAAAPYAPSSSSRMESTHGGGSHGCEDVEDYLVKIENLQLQLDFASNDARETRRQLDEQKKHFKAMLEEARRDNKSHESSGGGNSEYDARIEELEKREEDQSQENEGLRMQVESLKAALEVMPDSSGSGGLTGGYSVAQSGMSRDEQVEKQADRISWLETELVMAKMKLAEACAAGFIDSSQ